MIWSIGGYDIMLMQGVWYYVDAGSMVSSIVKMNLFEDGWSIGGYDIMLMQGVWYYVDAGSMVSSIVKMNLLEDGSHRSERCIKYTTSGVS